METAGGEAPLLRELDGMARNALKAQVWRCNGRKCFKFKEVYNRGERVFSPCCCCFTHRGVRLCGGVFRVPCPPPLESCVGLGAGGGREVSP